MKKLFIACITLMMLISILAVPVSANDEIWVLLNGEKLEFDVQPQIINGRTMVPMRKIFESLGASVEWENETKKITAKKQDTTIVMQINNNVLSLNGNIITLDVPPQLVDGRTLVPVRAVAESFDIQVLWDDVYKNVILSTIIPFDTSKQAFDYLCDWLLENGTTFANHTYIGWDVVEGIKVQVRCYPKASNGKDVLWFNLNTYEVDGVVTCVALYPTSDGSDIYAIYDSLGDDFHINGDINMERHTDSFPLSCVECEFEKPHTEYSLLEDTRERINILLNEVNLLLAFENTGVNLNTLGFKQY